MNNVKVWLADDHPVVRQGVRAVFESEEGFEVAGESSDGVETLNGVRNVCPEILILDLMMPHISGMEIIQKVREVSRTTRIVVLSMHQDEAYVVQALQLGATGYVLKDSSSSELVNAVRSAAEGRQYLSHPLSERAIRVYKERAKNTQVDHINSLTEREREVLQLVAEGHSNTEIASQFSISPRTVETHRAHLMQKLELKTRTDLIRYALRHGIISWSV